MRDSEISGTASPSGGQDPRRPLAPRVLGAAAALLLLTLATDDTRLRRERENLRSRAAELAGRLQSAETELAMRGRRALVLESDDVSMLALRGRDSQPGARGFVCWSEKARHGILVAGRLALLPADRQYQLWVFHGGHAGDAGVFDVDASGHALFETKDFEGARLESFAVTVEPRGGVEVPTGPTVMTGSPD
jgi:hypothetical protein